MITVCTEVIAVRSALASEQRPYFNTGLRLLSVASGVFNPNSTLYIVVAILLVTSYSSRLLLNLLLDLDTSGGSELAEGVAKGDVKKGHEDIFAPVGLCFRDSSKYCLQASFV